MLFCLFLLFYHGCFNNSIFWMCLVIFKKEEVKRLFYMLPTYNMNDRFRHRVDFDKSRFWVCPSVITQRCKIHVDEILYLSFRPKNFYQTHGNLKVVVYYRYFRVLLNIFHTETYIKKKSTKFSIYFMTNKNLI